jgi:hypothetical protein
VILPLAAREAALAGGCRIVCDYDDPSSVLALHDTKAHSAQLAGKTKRNSPSEVEREFSREIAGAAAVTASTEPLAQLLRAHGCDPIVLPSILDPRDWTVRPPRAARSRPRIGWFRRDVCATGDAVLVEAVVRALSAEADFVFFGRVPAVLADVAERLECRPSIPLALFPASLAACDLDLVLAPLAIDAAGECAGNLLLLQAGILGYPVIATDIEAHRGLPVTRLPNKPRRWIRALRESMGESAALQREGAALESAVLTRFTAHSWAQRYGASWTGGSRQTVNA